MKATDTIHQTLMTEEKKSIAEMIIPEKVFRSRIYHIILPLRETRLHRQKKIVSNIDCYRCYYSHSMNSIPLWTDCHYSTQYTCYRAMHIVLAEKLHFILHYSSIACIGTVARISLSLS